MADFYNNIFEPFNHSGGYFNQTLSIIWYLNMLFSHKEVDAFPEQSLLWVMLISFVSLHVVRSIDGQRCWTNYIKNSKKREDMIKIVHNAEIFMFRQCACDNLCKVKYLTGTKWFVVYRAVANKRSPGRSAVSFLSRNKSNISVCIPSISICN